MGFISQNTAHFIMAHCEMCGPAQKDLQPCNQHAMLTTTATSRNLELQHATMMVDHMIVCPYMLAP
jgi:hypothetical protein